MPVISKDLYMELNEIINENLDSVLMKLLEEKNEDFASLSENARQKVAEHFSEWLTSCANEYDDRGSMYSDVLSLEDVTDGKQDEPLSENGTIIYNALKKIFSSDHFDNEETRKYYLTLWSRTFQAHPECDAYVHRLQHLKKPTCEFFSDWSYSDGFEGIDNDDEEESLFARLHYIISRR